MRKTLRGRVTTAEQAINALARRLTRTEGEQYDHGQRIARLEGQLAILVEQRAGWADVARQLAGILAEYEQRGQS